MSGVHLSLLALYTISQSERPSIIIMNLLWLFSVMIATTVFRSTAFSGARVLGKSQLRNMGKSLLTIRGEVAACHSVAQVFSRQLYTFVYDSLL